MTTAFHRATCGRDGAPCPTGEHGFCPGCRGEVPVQAPADQHDIGCPVVDDHVTLADLPPLPARQYCDAENPTLLYGRSIPCLIDGPHDIHRDSTGREWGDLDDLHARALDEYRTWGQAKDYDALRELARTHYDTETLGRFLDSAPAGYPRRVFLDELHGQALRDYAQSVDDHISYARNTSTETLGEHLDRYHNHFGHQIFMDELHGRALANPDCDIMADLNALADEWDHVAARMRDNATTHELEGRPQHAGVLRIQEAERRQCAAELRKRLGLS